MINYYKFFYFWCWHIRTTFFANSFIYEICSRIKFIIYFFTFTTDTPNHYSSIFPFIFQYIYSVSVFGFGQGSSGTGMGISCPSISMKLLCITYPSLQANSFDNAEQLLQVFFFFIIYNTRPF